MGGVQLDRQAPILVTGSAGRIGRAAVSALLTHGWHPRGLDCRPTPGTRDFAVADLVDVKAVQQAASGAAAIIHLAGVPDDDDFLTRLLPNNIVGTHNILEAARLHGIKRVLLASSGQVNWYQQHEGPWPIRPDHPLTPRHWYAAGKVFMEAAGMGFARSFGMTVLALRLGWCPRTPQHLAELGPTDLGQDVYMSPGDAGRFFVRAMEADLEPGFSALYVASRPIHKVVFDLEPTKRLVGWEPNDQWPTGAADGLEA
jgi:uronate dehydrogenase